MLLHQNPQGEVLYAVAAEGCSPVSKEWAPIPITHIHAPSAHVARYRYLASVNHPGRVRIIALAPAIGWHGNEHGDQGAA